MERRSGSFKPIAPYRFDLFVHHLKRFTPLRNDHRWSNNTLTTAFRTAGTTIAMNLEAPQPADITDPKEIHCTLVSKDPMEQEALEDVVHQAQQWLGIDEDLAPFYDLAESDPVMQPITKQLEGLRHVKCITPFEALCWGLIRTHLPKPKRIRARQLLMELVGDFINLNGVTYRTFPEPHDLLEGAPRDIVTVTGSADLTDYLRAAARHFDTQGTPSPDDSNLISTLTSINGVTRRVALFTIRYGLGLGYEIDFADNGLRDALTKYYGQHSNLTEADVRDIADEYGDWKHYWAYYLTQHTLSP
ncbi:MAG: DNA-3-methyladenine glycosylase family protein [Bacteroidota bacterium]